MSSLALTSGWCYICTSYYTPNTIELLGDVIVCTVAKTVNFIELMIDSKVCNLSTSFILLLLGLAYLRRMLREIIV